MPAQINIVLLALGGIQALLLILLLSWKSKSLPGRSFLIAYLLVMTLQIVMKVVSKVWLMNNVRELYLFSYQLPFLYGPLIYLFICHSAGAGKLKWTAILHFIPSIIVLGIFISWNLYRSIPLLLKPIIHPQWSMVFQLASLFIYHRISFQLLQQSKVGLPGPLPGIISTRLKWLRQFVVGSGFICSIIAIVLCMMYRLFPRYQELRFGFSALTAFIYWISYKALSLPEIFRTIRGYAQQAQDKVAVPALTVHFPLKRYANSGLSEDALQSIVQAANNKMQNEKLYLRPVLTIDELAAAIGRSRHHLSQSLNEKLNKSFYDYTNSYRVEEAKLLLGDPGHAGHKIASIGYDAGFNSISTFNDVFRKIAGMTPTQFRQQEQKKDLRKQRV